MTSDSRQQLRGALSRLQARLEETPEVATDPEANELLAQEMADWAEFRAEATRQLLRD